MQMGFGKDDEYFAIKINPHEFYIAVSMLGAIEADDQDSVDKIVEYCLKLVELHEKQNQPKLTLVPTKE